MEYTHTHVFNNKSQSKSHSLLYKQNQSYRFKWRPTKYYIIRHLWDKQKPHTDTQMLYYTQKQNKNRAFINNYDFI